MLVFSYYCHDKFLLVTQRFVSSFYGGVTYKSLPDSEGLQASGSPHKNAQLNH